VGWRSVDPLFVKSFGPFGKSVDISTADLFGGHRIFRAIGLSDVVGLSRSSTRNFKPRKV
jgi:hypothetical protein